VRYLCIAFLIALLAACGTPSAALKTPGPLSTTIPTAERVTAAPVASTDAPTAEILATLATDAPAALATDTPAPTDEPTAELATLAPEPTSAPAAEKAGPLGVAPISKDDCPADHPVKGNIPAKGDKIYHLPGDNGYKATDPERCFVDAKEAEAAGFRAPK